MRASQAISREIMLDKLLATLMRIIIKNAGADSGSLILVSGGKLIVQATAAAANDEVRVLQSIPLSEAAGLPESIVNYVARTRETVLLDDPARQSRYQLDPALQARAPRSVLCLPILYQGRLEGVLYLENRLLAGAFTSSRVEALGLLLTQIAASLDNATLFAQQKAQADELARYQSKLEELVEERTRELKAAQGRLLAMSRRSGMADVATGILHNVGNVLNSVNVSVDSSPTGCATSSCATCATPRRCSRSIAPTRRRSSSTTGAANTSSRSSPSWPTTSRPSAARLSRRACCSRSGSSTSRRWSAGSRSTPAGWR